MDLKSLNIKIIKDFNLGNFRENFKDLIKIFKLQNDSDTANKLGVVLIKLNKIKYAEYFFKIAININKNNYKPLFNLANLYKKKDKKLSEKYVDLALLIDKKKEAILLKAHLLIHNFKYEEANSILSILNSGESFFFMGSNYLALGDDEKGKYYLNESLKYNNTQIDFLNLNTFPRIYQNTKDIFYFRKRFEDIIMKISSTIDKKNLSETERINILCSKTNFNLSYQQKNDIELNKKYQELCKIISNSKNEEIQFNRNKLVFISGFFYKHTVSKLFFNFVRELSNIRNFEVHLLHLSDIEDEWTEEYKNLNIKFKKLTNIKSIYDFLINEKFGSAFFLDHSMNNLSQAILCKKFAKNYYMFWGHPITTGSSNVDYFISSKFMDEFNQSHYNEKIILLDDIGFNYKLDDDLKNYKFKNINNNSFYIPQSLFKFLPKYDYLIGEILNQNKTSTISFIEDKDPYYTKKFIKRLKRIPNINHNFNRIIFFEGMNQKNYYEKLSSHKLIIDTLGWSGGNTTMEALYLEKPVITIKGNNLRSNHTAAILKKLELNELITNSYSEFLNVIKKINDENDFYESIVFKINKNKNLIFDNKVSLFKKIKNFI